MPDYNLQSLKLPRLTGRALTLFAAALDNPLARKLLLPSLLQQGGIVRLREIRFTEDPTVFPYAPAEVHARAPMPAAQVDAALQSDRPTLPQSSALGYAAAYRKGDLTPVQAAEKILAAIEGDNAAPSPLHAFIYNDRADVLAQAQASTERIRAGQALSLLDGVPVAVKDEVDQAPYPSHGGTTFLGSQPAQDSTVVARLRAAGALLIGKANMPELGTDPCGFNARFGTVKNPYNPLYDSGGSSSGPAAAVAAGFCPLAIGCDGGGSIRIPAALCGILGIKSTFGRISSFGSIPICPSVDAVGPLGASVADLVLAYGLIAGPDPRDPRSQFQPPVSLADWNNPDLHGLIFGVYRPWFEHAAPEVVAACQALLEKLVQAGAQVREIILPDLDIMRIAHAVTILSEMVANLADHREHRGKLSPSTRVTLGLAYGFSSTDYVQAQRVRTRAIAVFQQAFQQVDAILTPATAITAPLIPPGVDGTGWSDLSVTTEKMRYAFPPNLTGHPALSFPAGYDSQGLPIGMQAIGRYWEEHVLFRLAYAAEQVVQRQQPKIHYSIL